MNTLVATGKLIHYPKAKNNQALTPPTTPHSNGAIQPVPVVKVEPAYQPKPSPLVLVKIEPTAEQPPKAQIEVPKTPKIKVKKETEHKPEKRAKASAVKRQNKEPKNNPNVTKSCHRRLPKAWLLYIFNVFFCYELKK